MSGSATQIKLLTDCIRDLIQKAKIVVVTPEVSVLGLSQVQDMYISMGIAEDILEVEEKDWIFWTPTSPATDYTLPDGVTKNAKLEIQFEDGDLMVVRSNHINWGDANSVAPGRSVFRYRKLQ